MGEVIANALVLLGGGMLTASSLTLTRTQRYRNGREVQAVLRHTPVPDDTPTDMLELLDQLA